MPTPEEMAAATAALRHAAGLDKLAQAMRAQAQPMAPQVPSVAGSGGSPQVEDRRQTDTSEMGAGRLLDPTPLSQTPHQRYYRKGEFNAADVPIPKGPPSPLAVQAGAAELQKQVEMQNLLTRIGINTPYWQKPGYKPERLGPIYPQGQ